MLMHKLVVISMCKLRMKKKRLSKVTFLDFIALSYNLQKKVKLAILS